MNTKDKKKQSAATKKAGKDVIHNLFNEITDTSTDEHTLLLTSTSKSIKECFKSLSNRYNKTDIMKMAKGIENILLRFNIRDKENPTKSIERIDNYFSNPYLKEDYTWPVAIIFGDDENFKVYFNLLPDEIKLTWEMCYRRIYANGNDINKQTGKNLIVKEKSFYRNSYSLNNNLLTGFNLSCYYYNYHMDMQPYMWMPDFMWQIYNRVIANKDIHPLDKLTDNGLLLSYTNEANIGEQLLMLKQMQAQGMLEFGATKMALTTLKKAAQQISLPEFYPDANSKDLKLLAAQMMIPSIASYALDSIKVDFNLFWNIIKLIVSTCNTDAVAMQWISHLKAVKRDDFIYSFHRKAALENIINTLKMMPSGKWLSMEDFDNLRRTNDNITKDDLEVMSYSFVSREKHAHASSGCRLRIDEIYEQVSIPVCKGFLFMLATYGLLEVAYHVPTADEPVYGGLEYFRLTKLGEYVFGQSSVYNAPGIHKPSEYFEADNDRLIIRATLIDGKNPYESMLLNIAEPIGAHRYRITTETFMKGCETIDDLERKWTFIQQNVIDTPSAIWKKFYDNMRLRCQPLSNTGIGYSLKKIAAGNTELMQVMTTDKYIREHIIRAERNHILIETKCLEKVKQILRKYGYIL